MQTKVFGTADYYTRNNRDFEVLRVDEILIFIFFTNKLVCIPKEKLKHVTCKHVLPKK